ncbi:MAG: hypothetical protein DI536_35455 [Archangium gephyra]|uniref:Uncharacterized protein n=1 Tax=Archangium gephyra TaxID=48 RepID=A0A2W5SPW7_9BACT|nr:MAG: hypothetical protein DI536_35455 [Archangium gephyra]
MKREDIAAMGPLERKALLEDVAALVHSGEWRFGEAVRFLRAVVLRKSRADFSRMVGVSPSALQQIEDTLDANPTVDTLNRLFRPFGATMGLRFPRMELQPPPTVEREQRRERLKNALAGAHKRRRKKDGAQSG